MTIGPTRLTRARHASFASLLVLAACSGHAPVTAPATTITAASLTTTAPLSTTAVTTTSRTVTTTTTAATSAGLLCGRTAVQRTGTVASDELTEISGIAASRTQPDVVWVHNDSGAEAIVYALDLSGTLRARVQVLGATAVDWEDIAAGPGPDAVPSLFVADIGDNGESREHVVVYRLPEPDLTAVAVAADAVTLRYPDRAHNAEAFAVDPRTGDWYVITKESRESSTMFRVAKPGPGSSSAVLEAVATIRVRPDLITGADLSPDGSALAVRTYFSVRTYRVPDGDVAGALGSVACIGPFVDEAQGEAITFRADGRAMITISEGEHPAINLVG